MARVFPSIDELDLLPEPLNEGERQVLDQLRRLDDRWFVYVQPRLGLDQPDFVVMHPQIGVTAIEVKDWSVGAYRQAANGVIECRSGGGWRATGEAPRYQAHRYRSTIFDRYFADHQTSSNLFKAVRAVVIMVRHTTAEAEALLRIPRVSLQSEQRVRVWGAADLVTDPLLVLTGSRSPRAIAIPVGCIDRLRRGLAEPEVVSDQRMPLTLSAAAWNIERNISKARIRRVRGAAGSGKSLGLAARAARLALQGQKVLVVSFNVTLPHYLHDVAARRCLEIGAPLQRITFTHLHEFCSRVCDDAAVAGFIPRTARLPGMIDPFQELVERAGDAYLGGHGEVFDAVLVDEGQDFTVEWWNFLRHRVCKRGGEMMLVADLAQDVYDQRAWTDEDRMLGAGFRGPWTEVHGSYRLPPDLIPLVARFAAQHLDGIDVGGIVPRDHPLRSGRFEPTVRRWVDLPPGASCGRTLGAEVIELLRSHPDLAPADVVFLASSHKVGLEAVHVIESAGFPVQHVFSNDQRDRKRLKDRFWGMAPGVKGCTYHSFKGWEARAVVMSVMTGPNSNRLAYVGLTRVKGDRPNRPAFVTVVNSDRRLRAFGTEFMAS